MEKRPKVRKNSFDTELIEEGGHRAWFNRVLQDENIKLFIGISDGERMGQVRFNIDGTVAKISVSVSPELIGKGFGPVLIREGCRNMFENTGVKRIIAEIRPENERSRKAFQSAGFGTLKSDSGKTTMQLDKLET